jgi:hypothetical protein
MTTLASSADMVALVQVCTVLPIVLLSLPAGARRGCLGPADG